MPSRADRDGYMNVSDIELFSAAAVIAAVWMCGVTTIKRLLWGLAVQTTMIAVIAALHGIEIQDNRYLMFAGVIFIIKAAAVPAFLSWIADKLEVTRDRGIGLNSTLALFAGCAAMALGYFLAPGIIQQGAVNPGAASMAITLLLIGMLFMLIKKLAISQVIGFLVLENGITLYALTQTHGMPLMVEMGVIFDVLVAVMLAGLVMFRLNRSFEHIDATKFRGLKH